MRLEKMQAAAKSVAHLRGKELDAALTSLGIVDVVDRIAIKHSLTASGLATDEVIPLGGLRTDKAAPGQGGPAPRQGVSEIDTAMRRTLARAGLSLQSKMSVKLFDSMIDKLELPPEERLRMKLALESEGLLVDDLPATPAPARKTMKAADADKPAKRTFTVAELEQWFDDLDLDGMTRTLLKAQLLKAGRLIPGTKTPDTDLQAGSKAGKTCKYTLSCSTNDFDRLR